MRAITRRNDVAKELRTLKYRPRVVRCKTLNPLSGRCSRRKL
jgi:hypothetical protein